MSFLLLQVSIVCWLCGCLTFRSDDLKIDVVKCDGNLVLRVDAVPLSLNETHAQCNL